MKFLQKLISNNQFISLANQGLSASLSFISFLLLTRVLGLNDFGTWTVIITGFTFYDMFRSGFLHSALMHFGSSERRKESIASCWTIGIVVTLVSIIIAKIIFEYDILNLSDSFRLFLKWFPLLISSALLYNIALWVAQLNLNFKRILFIRVFQLGIFISCLGYEYFSLNSSTTLESVLIYYIVSISLPGLFETIVLANRIHFVRFVTKSSLLDFWNYGKYTVVSLIGSNLLKSSDIFIISAMLGDKWVAIYAVPLKVIEVIEIPIRAFISIALPKFSQYFYKKDIKAILGEFQKYVGSLTLGLIPILLLSFLLAPFLIEFLGGEPIPESIIILQVFTFYGLLVPLDRFLGITLDSLRRPQLNSIKIYLMIIVNIVGDIIFIKLGYGVTAVALVTIITSSSGVLFGSYFVKSILKINNITLFIFKSFKESITFIKSQLIGKPTF